MKIFIIVDLEGISGVVNFKHQAHPNGFLYPEARRALMRDLNSAIEGAVAEGADEVLVYDSHFYGLNLIPETLLSNVRVILGKPLCNGIDRSFSAAMLIGYHAMAGTPEALLAHTYSLDIKAIWLNNMPVGEIGMEAALAGQLDVPVIMVSGDSSGLDEAFRVLPGVELAVVKESIGVQAAKCLPSAESEKLIRLKAQEAMKKIKDINPYKIAPPFEIRMEFSNPDKVKRLSQEKNVITHDDRTVTIKDKDLRAAWLTYKRIEKDFEEQDITKSHYACSIGFCG
jgi:D-amino peptidase